VSAIDEITRFQTDRELDRQEFDWDTEAVNILEELLEALGINNRSIAIDAVSEINKIIHRNPLEANYNLITTNEKVDAFGDIIVFACGALTKLGYDPEKVLLEVAKEINSREGEMVNGKFTKYKTKEAMDKWVKADFTSCKLLRTTEKQRKAFLIVEGYMGSEEEVEKWLKELI